MKWAVDVTGFLLSVLIISSQISCSTSSQPPPHQDLPLDSLESQKNSDSQEIIESLDENGYIAFCPCMGRFGNQADQFLGALGFAKRLNRTLILPPWNEYIPYQTGSIQVPFDKYFKPEPLQAFHRIITMDRFMSRLAPQIWPPHKRISFCYMERGEEKGCDAKDGNPFGPFWDNFNIDFVGSEIFGPDLHYLTSYRGNGKDKTGDWASTYPGHKWPVLAFVGPPSSFPVEDQYSNLQQYLSWQDEILDKAKAFISTLPKGPFVGLHLRNGPDWSRVCELVEDSKQLFSSPQCLGYGNEYGKLSQEMCLPSTATILKQLKRTVKRIQATSVFVASDRNHLLPELSLALKKLGVTVKKLDYDSPHVDLAILNLSNGFIGNCISSYSAFVKRSRDVNGSPSEFWGFPPDRLKKSHSLYEELHDEL